jgi:AGZA family xanthine/uracil permease-like MFS transporter
MAGQQRYRWAQWGDLNAFFGLMLDNITTLVVFTGILAGVFGYPIDKIYSLMIPGTALGVLFGDCVYTWLAFRLAKKTGSSDVTAMPLGLDTPSTIGIATAVLGPVYLETKDAILTWQVGMATLMIIGIFKTILSFFGESIRRRIPQAGLLGSLAGNRHALLASSRDEDHLGAHRRPGFAWNCSLRASRQTQAMPFAFPGRFSPLRPDACSYISRRRFPDLRDACLRAAAGIASGSPAPTVGFLFGFGKAISYLPIAFPFAVLTHHRRDQ